MGNQENSQYLLAHLHCRNFGLDYQIHLYSHYRLEGKNLDNWRRSLWRSTMHEGHPWRTLNLAAKAAYVNGWMCRCYFQNEMIEVWQMRQELKLAKCELERISQPEKFVLRDYWKAA